MNRELLVTLIRKNIDELIMLTEGFMEMDTYPAAIINLAKNKTDDIWSYINQLENVKTSKPAAIPAEEELQTPEKEEEKEDIFASMDTEDSEEELKEPAPNPVEESVVAEIIEEDAVEETVFAQEEAEAEAVAAAEEEEEEEDDDDDDESPEEIIEEEDITVEEIQDEEEDEDESGLEDEAETIEIEKDDEVDDNGHESQIVEDKKVTLAEKISAASFSSRNDSLGSDDNEGLNTVLGNKKVDDIRQAISLGDRFRFQRELFKNNGEEMNKTLSYINMLATYEEVISFLQSKYAWEEDNPTAEDFYQLVKRKF